MTSGFVLIGVLLASFMLAAPALAHCPTAAGFFTETLQSSRQEPVQVMLEGAERECILKTLTLKQTPVHIRPLAAYQIVAQVISVRKYIFEENSAVAPLDIAVAWGRVPDSDIFPKLKFEHSFRWITFRYRDALPVDTAYLQSHIANIHIIPSSPQVRSQLAKIGKNRMVRLTGYLVALRGDREDGRWYEWQSSLTRDDSGNHACELMWLEAVTVLETP